MTYVFMQLLLINRLTNEVMNLVLLGKKTQLAFTQLAGIEARTAQIPRSPFWHDDNLKDKSHMGNKGPFYSVKD